MPPAITHKLTRGTKTYEIHDIFSEDVYYLRIVDASLNAP